MGVAQICAAAEVQKGSFFHFFPTKEALVVEVLELRWAEMRATTAAAFADDVPPLARFARYFGLLGERLQAEVSSRGCPIGNLVSELGTRSPAVRSAVARCFDELRDVFRGAIDEAQARGDIPAPHRDSATTADALVAFLQGLAVLSKTHGEFDRIRQIAVQAGALLGAPDLLIDPTRHGLPGSHPA